MENVLAKKLSMKSVSRSPVADVERLGDLFVRLFETALRPLLQTTISGMVLDCEVTKMASVSEGIPVPALLGVLDYPGSANSVLINMSADLVYHIIDLRLGADSGVCPVPTTRSFTGIDYALCRQALIEVGNSFEEAIETVSEGPLRDHFSLSDIKQNITTVTVAPDNADVLVISASLDIGTAARGGDFDFIVPLSVLDVIRAAVDQQRTDDRVSANDIWRTRMRKAAQDAEVPMTALLHRGHYTANFIDNLEVGQVIPIPSNATSNVSLVMNVGTQNEVEYSNNRLGGFEGRKVLKLIDEPNKSMVAYLRKSAEEAPSPRSNLELETMPPEKK